MRLRAPCAPPSSAPWISPRPANGTPRPVATHLLYFLQLPGAADPSLESGGRIALNRALLQALRSIPDLQDWSANELERFLYSWSDPRAARRAVKISPGEDARLWDDCLANG
jgi:5-methylcytosine-specific restriction protein B